MKFTIFILAFIPSIAFSQDSLFYGFPIKGDKISYEIVITVDSTSKNSLFTKAKNWALGQFNSQKDALQVDDREGGILAYRGYFANFFEWPPRLGISPKEEWQYWETFKILFKDNKVKVFVTDFKIKSMGISYTSATGTFNNISLETFPEESDSMLKKFGNGEKYRDKFRENMVKNFKEANLKVLLWIESLKKALLSKENMDF